MPTRLTRRAVHKTQFTITLTCSRRQPLSPELADRIGQHLEAALIKILSPKLHIAWSGYHVRRWAEDA